MAKSKKSRKYQDECKLCSHKFYCDHHPVRDMMKRCQSFNSIYFIEDNINKIINGQSNTYDVYDFTYMTEENRHRYLKFIDRILEMIEENKRKNKRNGKSKQETLNDMIQRMMLENLENSEKR